MSPALHERLRELFLAGCRMEPEAQRALLSAARAEDPELGRELEKLLAHDSVGLPGVDDASGAPVALGAQLLARALAEGDAADSPVDLPSHIGRYTILGVIGEGGMGIVYEARQEDPERSVALKVIRPGVITRSLLRRFHHEAQVLGQLQHPGIAQIYEAGTADRGEGGQPFFAMELVRGRPLLEFAATAALGTRARLELVARVCDALHHAHQKGVIHRDLKPANILVTADGQPKILDFGVARATDADVQTMTMQTDVGQLIGTIPYMSPEQAAGDPAQLDIRSDIYGLGVITYELLTGRLPYDVSGKLIHEAVRVIQEEPPTRLSSTNRALRGDVETIVGKALAKEKDRRYQSAAELAADIRRWLRDEPIVARPSSAMYQLRKFARRHTALVTAVGVTFAVLLAATVVSLWLLALAQDAREVARSEADIARIAAAASFIDGGDPLSARATLDAIPPERRNWEWRYHAARLDRSIASFDLGERVWSAQFVGDGSEIIAATASGLITRWSIDRDEPRSSVRLNVETSGRIEFDRDGRFAAAGTGKGESLVVWSTGDARRAAEHDLGAAMAGNLFWARMAVGPSTSTDLGRIVFLTGNRRTFLLGGDPSPVELNQRGMTGGVLDVAMSCDGRRAAACWHDGLGYFDPASGERLLDFNRPNIGQFLPIEFIGEGHRVALGCRKRVFIFDPDRTDLLPALQGHSGVVVAVASDPSGRWLASGATDTTVRVWDLETLAPVAILCGHARAVLDVDFSADGTRLLTAADDGTVRLWSRETQDRDTVLRGHTSYVYALAFSSDGRRIYSGAWDGNVRVWDAAGGECIATIATGEAWVASLALSPDDSCLVTGHGYGRVQFRDAESGARLGEHVIPTRDSISNLAFDRESSDLLIRGPQWLKIVRRPADASIAERTAVWIARAPVEPLIPMGAWTEEQKSAVACSPRGAGGHVAVAWIDHTVRLLDRRNGAEIHRLVPEPTPPAAAAGLCFSLAFSPDGRELAAGLGDGTIRIWDTASGELLRTLTGHQAGVYALAFSPDGTRLSSGSDDTSIRIWDPRSGMQVAMLPGHDDYIFSLAFSPDGATLASGSGDTTLRVWDTRPAHERWKAESQMRALRAAARPMVEKLISELSDPAAVAAHLRADASLPPLEREAALQALLRLRTASGAPPARSSVAKNQSFGRGLCGRIAFSGWGGRHTHSPTEDCAMFEPNRNIVVLLALSASGPVLAGVPVANVLVLADDGSEGQVIAALMATGHAVVNGGPYYEWDGSGLEGIDAVIYLDGPAYGNGLTEQADAALAAFVSGGGRLIMTEWTAWDSYYGDVGAQVSALMPVSTPDASYSFGDTWIVSDPDHPLAAGVPASWFDGAGWTNVVAHPLATVVATGAGGNPLVSYRTDAGGPVVHINHDMTLTTPKINPNALDLLVNAVSAPLSPPPCPWDLDHNGDVGITDLLDLLAAWGTSAAGPPDFDGDGAVGIGDLLALLAAWGACP